MKDEEIVEEDYHEEDETARLITADSDDDLVTRAVFTRSLQPGPGNMSHVSHVSSDQSKYSDYSHKGASGAIHGCIISVVKIVIYCFVLECRVASKV